MIQFLKRLFAYSPALDFEAEPKVIPELVKLLKKEPVWAKTPESSQSDCVATQPCADDDTLDGSYAFAPDGRKSPKSEQSCSCDCPLHGQKFTIDFEPKKPRVRVKCGTSADSVKGE